MLRRVPNGQAASSPPRSPEERRADILGAASTLLAERSWDGFTMRDVATRAGLSAGAVYQYFEGKRDIFASLYAERLEQELDSLEGAGNADLDSLARRLVEDFGEIYARFGRHQLAWAAEGIERSPAVERLGAAFNALAAAVETTLAAAAAPAGRELVPGAGRMPYLWAVVNGVGDQLLGGRYRLHDCSRDEFLSFAAGALVAGLTRPAG